MASIVVLIITIASALYNIFAWGFVCLQFYWWFILPVFPDLPRLNLWQCIGLMFFISLFKTQSYIQYKGKEGEEWYDLFGALALPWITLLIAYFFA